MPTQQQLDTNGLFYQIANTDTSNFNVTGITVAKANVTGNLSVTGNTTITGNLTLGGVSTFKLSGGTTGQVLTTDGSGTLSWSTVAGGGSAGVTEISTSTTGAGLGFSLSGGPISSTGTITLSTPTATSLRTSLGVGTVGLINTNGNSQQVLLGNGVFGNVPVSTAVPNVPNLNGSTTQFLRGDGQWTVPPVTATSSTGVTSIDASVSSPSLGFSFSGGPVTSAGTLTLNVPQASTLRTSLGLGSLATINATGITNQYLNGAGSWQVLNVPTGNIANTNYPSLNTTTTYLRGDGQWVAPPSTSGGSGTVTRVQASGSGLGFGLTGDISSSGSITLTTPSSSSLRAALGIGNVANLNFATGSPAASYFLSGDGQWRIPPVQAPTGSSPGGNSTEIQFNDGGVLNGVSALTYNKSSSELSVGSITEVTKFATTYTSTTGVFSVDMDVKSSGITMLADAQTSTFRLNLVNLSLFATANRTLTTTFIFRAALIGMDTTTINIDGTAATIKWANASKPTYDSQLATYAVTFTFIKQNTVGISHVLASWVRYL